MTIARLEAVGFCAHYSQQGDWAFDFAYNLARTNSLQLNIFHFLSDPYAWEAQVNQPMTPSQRSSVIVDLEKEMRLYYDAKLGDFLDAGFRLCEDREWTELHRCLTKREFQVLVLACPTLQSKFAGKAIDEFAGSFICPVVLVGPQSPFEYRLNQPAAMMAERLGLGDPTVGDSGQSRYKVVHAEVPSLAQKQMGW